ncbi:Pairing protein 2 family protein, partial [Globisporangium splendens]
MKNDDFDDEEDFSLDDASDDDDDDAFSAASEEEEDDAVSDEDEAVESDFEDAPKSKRAKKASAKSKATPKKQSPAPAKKTANATMTKKVAASTKKAAATVAKKSSPVKKTPVVAAAPAIKPGDAKTAVLDYMRKVQCCLNALRVACGTNGCAWFCGTKTNRPYSLLNVFENLHRAVAKPALTKILDDLCGKEELASKTYGKTKIYYMNQNKLPLPSSEERAQVEQQIKSVEAECVALEQELKASEATLSSINSQISDADLTTTLQALEEERAALETKFASLRKPGQKPISPGRKDALKRKFTTYRTAWVQRKRIVIDAVNQIADGMEKKPAAVNELCGIETDADVGIKEIPTI